MTVSLKNIRLNRRYIFDVITETDHIKQRRVVATIKERHYRTSYDARQV